MVTQQTSLDGWQSIQTTLGVREAQVLAALRKYQPINNRMLAARMKLPVNQVTPRMNALAKERRVKGRLIRGALVKEFDRKKDPLTTITTIRWCLVSFHPHRF